MKSGVKRNMSSTDSKNKRYGFLIEKKGQVWVETVIYTLIAFSLMALVLGFARPKIQESQDKAAIEQTIEAMQEINSVFEEIRGVSGNKRVVEFGIRKGFMKIDPLGDNLIFELEGTHEYSEPGVEISEGTLKIVTSKIGKLSIVNISGNYSNYNLTYQGEETSKIVTQAPTPYKISFSNEGKDSQGKTVIDINLN